MQTSVDTYLAKASAGKLYDIGNNDVISKAAQGDVFFGAGLRVVSETVYDVPAASGFTFGGVALHNFTKELDTNNTSKYVQHDAISVLRHGRVWVKAETAISIGDPVYLRHTAGGAGQVVGNFRNDADGGKATLINAAKATWQSTTTGTFELALLQLNNIN